MQSGTAASYGIGYGLDGFVLPDNPLVQFRLQMQQFVLFALQHLAYRYAGPAGYYVGDVFSVHFLFNHGLVTLHFVQFLLRFFNLLVQRLQFAVTDFGHPAIVAFPFCFVGLELQVLYFHLILLDFVDKGLFTLPFRLVRVFLLFQLGKFFADLFQFGLVVFALDGFTFNLQLLYLTRNLVQLFRYGIDLHTQLGGGFVHQVDSLVRQETVGDVTVAQLYGGDDGIVLNPYVVMVLITFLQTTQNGDGAQCIRFVHHDNLEAALQRFVLFEILLIFIEGSGPDAPQFTACQGGFQDVGGIHGTFALAGTHQGVDFINEEDNVSFRLLHFVDNGLQTFFKFAFVLGASHQCTHIQGVDLFVLQVLGDVSTQDTVGKSLYDSCFTGTRFTDKNRVVLGTPTQNLQDTPYLFVTADDGIQFAAAGCFVQIDGILFQ